MPEEQTKVQGPEVLAKAEVWEHRWESSKTQQRIKTTYPLFHSCISLLVGLCTKKKVQNILIGNVKKC